MKTYDLLDIINVFFKYLINFLPIIIPFGDMYYKRYILEKKYILAVQNMLLENGKNNKVEELISCLDYFESIHKIYTTNSSRILHILEKAERLKYKLNYSKNDQVIDMVYGLYLEVMYFYPKNIPYKKTEYFIEFPDHTHDFEISLFYKIDFNEHIVAFIIMIIYIIGVLMCAVYMFK